MNQPAPSPHPPVPTQVVWTSRIRYAECDRFGIAHHSSHVPWFECGRTELLRLLGHDYDEVEKQGFAYPLAELGFRYDAPGRLDELLEVECGVWSVNRLRLTFACRIFSSSPDRERTRIARGFSVHALVNQEMQVLEIPQDFRDFLEPRILPDGFLGRRFGPTR